MLLLIFDTLSNEQNFLFDVRWKKNIADFPDILKRLIIYYWAEIYIRVLTWENSLIFAIDNSASCENFW